MIYLRHAWQVGVCLDPCTAIDVLSRTLENTLRNRGIKAPHFLAISFSRWRVHVRRIKYLKCVVIPGYVIFAET